jgi:hypothetical protein
MAPLMLPRLELALEQAASAGQARRGAVDVVSVVMPILAVKGVHAS